MRALTRELDADYVRIPEPEGHDTSWPWSDALEQWRAHQHQRARTPRIVVAVLRTPPTPLPIQDTTLESWMTRAEHPLAVWVAALGVAAMVCADGGAIVAVVDRVPPLHSATYTAESAVADAVEALVRSLARSEVTRGVCVNAVTTPVRLGRAAGTAPIGPPALASSGGTITGDLAGTVGLLLGAADLGVTGTVIHADGRRSWR